MNRSVHSAPTCTVKFPLAHASVYKWAHPTPSCWSQRITVRVMVWPWSTLRQRRSPSFSSRTSSKTRPLSGRSPFNGHPPQIKSVHRSSVLWLSTGECHLVFFKVSDPNLYVVKMFSPISIVWLLLLVLRHSVSVLVERPPPPPLSPPLCKSGLARSEHRSAWNSDLDLPRQSFQLRILPINRQVSELSLFTLKGKS